jgi:hypothetical protein
MRAEPVPLEPWRSFLEELDGLLEGEVELRCLGGFVVTQQYGIGRQTADIDFLSRDREDFLRLARAGYIDRRVLQDRYYEELRPYLLSRISWHDKTLELWLEMAWPTP